MCWRWGVVFVCVHVILLTIEDGHLWNNCDPFHEK
jgi:hypothetical protein